MGMDGFPESDWKQLRKVYDAAFIRFCETSLKKAKAIIEDGSLSPQDRYDKLSNYLKSNRKDLTTKRTRPPIKHIRTLTPCLE